MADRSSQRHRVLKAGKIELAGGGGFDCTVRNLSETGAALDVVSPIGIPDTFTLVIAHESRLSCRVVWRKETRIGVTFKESAPIDRR